MEEFEEKFVGIIKTLIFFQKLDNVEKYGWARQVTGVN
jgi:hypothetical protein